MLSLMGIVLPTQGGGASWQPRGQDHGQSPTLSLGVALGTCPCSMKLELTSERGSKQAPVLGQSHGKVGMEKAGNIYRNKGGKYRRAKMQHKVEPGSFLLSPASPHCLERGQGRMRARDKPWRHS